MKPKKPKRLRRDDRRIVLGFDPGLNLGWAVMEYYQDDPSIKPIRLSSGVVRNNSDVALGQRLLELTVLIMQLFITHRPNLVGIEKVTAVRGGTLQRKKQNDHTWVLYFVYGLMKMFAYLFQVHEELVHPVTMKSQFTWSGDAEKSLVMAYADQYMPDGERTSRSDEADAIGIAVVAWMTVTDQLLSDKERQRLRECRIETNG